MEDEFIGRCGITDRCLERIDSIVFVEFPEVNMEVRMGERVAFVESYSAFFDMVSPVSGRITEINTFLEHNPTIINRDPYGEGWIYKIDIKEPNEISELMTSDEYNDYSDGGGDI